MQPINDTAVRPDGHARPAFRPVRPLGPLAGAALVAIAVVQSIVMLAGTWGDYARVQDLVAGRITFPELRAAELDSMLGSLGTLGLVALGTLAAAALFLVWQWRARQNTDLFSPVRHRLSAGWAIGAWFVPVANWVLPAIVMNDLARASDPRDAHRRVDPIVAGWWGTLVLGSLLSTIAFFAIPRAVVTYSAENPRQILDGADDALSSYYSTALVNTAGSVLLVVGALLIAVLVNRISTQQTELFGPGDGVPVPPAHPAAPAATADAPPATPPVTPSGATPDEHPVTPTAGAAAIPATPGASAAAPQPGTETAEAPSTAPATPPAGTPTAAPTASAGLPPWPAQEPRRHSMTLGRVTIAAVWVTALTGPVGVALTGLLYTGGGTDAVRQAGMTFLFGVAAILVGVGVSGILVISWLVRARTTAESLSSAPHRLPRAWAVAGWLVPLANLVVPALVVQDVVRASDPAAAAHRTPAALPLWWAGWVGGWVAFWVGLAVSADSSRQSMLGMSTFGFLAVALFALAAGSFTVLVGQVDRWQADRVAASGG